jgi:two-component system response regulator BaeR
MTHVLIVEDEPKIADVLRAYCERESFRVSVHNDGSGATEWIAAEQPDFVVLDLMLPGKDGLTICREVRRFSTVPILMLTARVDEIDRLLGLELGADDYVCKPFSPREVIARIRTILRRVSHAPVTNPENTLLFEGIAIDPDRFSCTVRGQPVELTPVELRILTRLIRQPGRVFSRDAIIRAAYDDHRIVSDRTVDSHMKNLRRKIDEAGGDAELIRSIYGVGYKIG